MAKFPTMPDSGMSMAELKRKWICLNCGRGCVDGEYLTAPDPFDSGETITACPHCREVEALESGCQAEGGYQRSSSGNPDVGGHRYVWACWKHAPSQGLWTRADPGLIESNVEDKKC